MVKIIALACAGALLAGCAARPPVSPPLAASAAPRLPSPPGARVPECATLDASIAAEAAAPTSLASAVTGGAPALSAALMASEARKIAALQQAIRSYQLCSSKVR